MKKLLYSIAFLLLVSHGLLADEETQIPKDTASRTLAIEVPGKITAVYWSIQKSNYVFQINFPSRPRGSPAMPIPNIQVWLLNADGTSIRQSNQSETKRKHAPGFALSGMVRPLLFYKFPASAASEPVAIVISVDGKLLIESLKSTSNP